MKGVSEAFGIRSILGDWGQKKEVVVWTDSIAAKGISNRIGLSKRTRHVAVHYLWVQERVERGDVVVRKVAGERNPADCGTKYLTQEIMKKHLSKLPIEIMEKSEPEQ